MTAVSIVLPTLNEERYLPRTLDCLAARVDEAAVDAEVIMVDGGSSDGTRRIAAGHGVVDAVLRHGAPGILAARHRGIEAAAHDVIVQVDADTVYDAGWLDALTGPVVDGAAVLAHGPVRGMGWERGVRKLYAWSARRLLGRYAAGQNRAFRRGVYERAGGYDRSVPPGSALRTSHEEEVRFVERVARHGRVVERPDAVCRTAGRNLRAMVTPLGKGGGRPWAETRPVTLPFRAVARMVVDRVPW